MRADDANANIASSAVRNERRMGRLMLRPRDISMMSMRERGRPESIIGAAAARKQMAAAISSMIMAASCMARLNSRSHDYGYVAPRAAKMPCRYHRRAAAIVMLSAYRRVKLFAGRRCVYRHYLAEASAVIAFFMHLCGSRGFVALICEASSSIRSDDVSRARRRRPVFSSCAAINHAATFCG